VLYLRGPEPLNDLEVLIQHGVDPHNVWAVESDPQTAQHAVRALQASGLPIKFYPGALSELFELCGGDFDMVYIDSCAPFGAGSPNTLGTLLHLFKHQRLSPLAALITTYAELPTPIPTEYASVMSAYFRVRYNAVPRALFEADLDPEWLQHSDEELIAEISRHHEPYYSDFVTRLTSDLARSLIPMCRALALPGVIRSHMERRESRDGILARAEHGRDARPGTDMDEWIRTVGDFALNPSGYPLLSFLKMIETRSPNSAIWQQLRQVKLGSLSLLDSTRYGSLLDHVFEGHWHALGEELLQAIRIGWFDRDNHFSCDAALPNLMVNSFLGIWGQPAFVNPRVSHRLKYKAKETTMYTDMLVLDRCRSFFDWFPTMQVAPSRFRSPGFQVLARCILDRIGWADWNCDSHPFRGSAVAGMGDTQCAEPLRFGPRECIS